MKTEELIGKELDVNTQNINRCKSALDRILPAVQKVINEHQKLMPGTKFTQAIWEKIIEDNGVSVCEAYRKQAEDDLKNFRNEAVKASIMANLNESMEPFRLSIMSVKGGITNAIHSTTFSIDISLNDIAIKSGKPEVDLTRIKEAYTLRITNESQAAIYQAGKEAEAALAKLKSLLDGNKVPFDRLDWVGLGWAVFNEQIPGNSLTFNPYLISG
jgi:hypothetical protein